MKPPSALPAFSGSGDPIKACTCQLSGCSAVQSMLAQNAPPPMRRGCPEHYFFGLDGGRLIVSTTAPRLLARAFDTLMNRPVPALRPIFIATSSQRKLEGPPWRRSCPG